MSQHAELARELHVIFGAGEDTMNTVLAALLPQHWVRSSEYGGHTWELVSAEGPWHVVARAYGKGPLDAFIVMVSAYLDALGRPHAQLSSIAARLMLGGHARSLDL